MEAVLAMLGLLSVGMLVFVFDVVAGPTAALVSGASVTLVVLALLVVTPRALVSADD